MTLKREILVGMSVIFILIGIGSINKLYYNQDLINERIERDNIKLMSIAASLQEQIDSNNTNAELQFNSIKLDIVDLYKLSIFTNQTISKLAAVSEELDNRTKEPDIDYLLSTDVYVQGLEGSGSGTVIKKEGNNMYILTCYHVIADIDKLNKEGKSMGVGVGYYKKDDKGNYTGIIMYGAEIVKVDESEDLALLKTFASDSALNVAKIATEQPKQGDTVYTCGNPLLIIRNLSKGILSNHLDGFYVVDATTTFGNSGGGLYDKNGCLIGVPAQVPLYYYNPEQQIIVPETSMGMCIDLLRIREFLGDII